MTETAATNKTNPGVAVRHVYREPIGPEPPLPATKTAFIAEYRTLLPLYYAWAQNPVTLGRFMESVRRTIVGGENAWDWNAPLSKLIWTKMGMRTRMTLKGLRALPMDS